MKKKLLTFLCCALLPGYLLAEQTDANTQEARGLVKAFMGELKGELQAAMKDGGPVNAIGVCNLKAPEIAAQKSAESGWELARTSLKNRNPDNAPDPHESNILQMFDARKAAGEDVTAMEMTWTMQKDGKRYFRYMKAIPTGEICLKCHGHALNPEVAEKLDALYPDDKARGYEKGDIRGAFTFQKPL
jgi:hypothetical protein